MKKILLAMVAAALCGVAFGAGTTGYAYFTNYAALDPSPSQESGGACYSCYLINNDTVDTAAGLGTWLKENGGITRANIASKSAAELLSDKDYQSLVWDGIDQYALQMKDDSALTIESNYKYAVIIAATEKTSEAPDFAYEILKGVDDGGGWTFDDKSTNKDSPVTWTPAPTPPVTVKIPEVAGATAELFAFDVNGGWKAVAVDKVPSNAMVRVVWTADEGKGLSCTGATNAYQWQAEFVADKAVQTVPAPTVGEAGASEVTIDIDTRADKTYIKADDILPVWYAAGADGAEVKAKGEGERSWETLVKSSATTNTLSWKPTEPDTYTLSHSGFENATIKLVLPVEVTTNGLEAAGTTVQVLDASGNPLVAQAEGEFAGKLIVPTNSTVKVIWTATGAGVYFMDGTTTYAQTFAADKSVNPAGEAVVMPEAPAAPSVKVGVVAQRYPWDGKLDVQYWAKNTPNGVYQIKVTVTLPDGTTASEEHDALNGVNTTVFDAKAAFGEVKFAKGVKVKAELVEAAPPK